LGNWPSYRDGGEPASKELKAIPMKNNQLLEYIFGQGNLFSPAFSHWIESSERFKSFAQRYKDKIRKKVTEAQKGQGNKEEALKDVLYELQTAYLMLRCDQFTGVDYEKYGTGKQRSPDFTVTFETGVIFNVEVKRIREGLPEVRLATWKRQMRSHVSTIPSSLALSVHVLRDRFDNPVDWLNRLEKETLNTIEYIKATNAIHEEKEDIPVGEAGLPHPVPGFEGEVEIVFRKPPQKSTRTLDWYGGEFPVFNTQREYRKFGDAIVYSLGQMVPDMINVLVISTDSNTHGYFDFGEALKSLAEMIASGEDGFFTQKGFSSIDDFLGQAGKLSGVLFRSAWVPLHGNGVDEFDTLWHNTEADRSSLLPPEIGRALEAMS
jgi:hypothetical protein